MIELIKQVMSRDIVCANVDKLRQVDSLVGQTLFHSAVRGSIDVGVVGARFLRSGRHGYCFPFFLSSPSARE